MGVTGVKDVEYWITVKKLKKKGMSIRKIAKELGISRNTVRKILREEHRQPYKTRIYTTKIDEYTDRIKEWYLNPTYDFIGTRIYEAIENLFNDSEGSTVELIIDNLKALVDKHENGK